MLRWETNRGVEDNPEPSARAGQSFGGKQTAMKRTFFLAVASILLLTISALAEPLPLEGPAPYPPVMSALSEDGLSYDDGTLKIRIVPDESRVTKLYYVYVTITDPTQLRTAYTPRGRSEYVLPLNFAKRNNAVLTVNGDFYNWHNDGVVYRQGKKIRYRPSYIRDELLIDENGDLTIIAVPDHGGNNYIVNRIKEFQEKHEIWQAFCFGPGLIVDGQEVTFNYRRKTSCQYHEKTPRVIFCQMGPLEYMFLITEGRSKEAPGYTIPECVEILKKHGGVQQAYNLDGGNSTHLILCGKKINVPDRNSRAISDIIYFATLAGQ